MLGSYLGNFAGGDPNRAPEFSLQDAEASNDPKDRKLHRILTQYAKALTPVERDLLARLSLFPRGVKVELLGWIVQSGGEVPAPSFVDSRDCPSPDQDPLTHWFWAAYLMTTDKRGVSALLLQRQLGLSCYETAWMMLHKLRRAMVNAVREPLHGEVEVDDTWVGGEQAGLRGSRQLKNRRAALVLVTVEKRG